MLPGEGRVGQDVFFGFVHQLGEPREASPKAIGHFAPLLVGALRVGWAKTVRKVAPTICWAAFGTNERALRMKCTRQRCHEAPCRTASMAPFRPRWESLVTKLTPESPL